MMPYHRELNGEAGMCCIEGCKKQALISAGLSTYGIMIWSTQNRDTSFERLP